MTERTRMEDLVPLPRYGPSRDAVQIAILAGGARHELLPHAVFYALTLHIVQREGMLNVAVHAVASRSRVMDDRQIPVDEWVAMFRRACARMRLRETVEAVMG